MRLAIISHKICRTAENSPTGYATDGGFPLQVQAISELFDKTSLLVPCQKTKSAEGLSAIGGNELRVVPLTVPGGSGIKRKLNMLGWIFANSPSVWREIRKADAVHVPIPGDVGTVGVAFALVQRKPLFVRHCGNWLVQRTFSEKIWRRAMEYFAGGKNVMLATGGSEEMPSRRNPNLKWIFATSLRKNEIEKNQPKRFPENGELKLIIVCRQEKRKGTEIVIESLPLILRQFPEASLDIVGGGSLLETFKKQALELNLENRVKFHGKVPQARVVELLKQAHLFCYPTSASEGFPKVVLEALASGLPVITTNVSVLPQLLSSGCGLILDGASAAHLSMAVAEICSDEKRYNLMSAAAIETARQYSLENWRDFIGDVLREQWNVASLSTISR
jgi:glycosyltransferase involved in cell wall biosynthesis